METDLYVTTATYSRCKWVRAYKERGAPNYLICEWPAGTFWVVPPEHDWGTDPAVIPDATGPFPTLEVAHATAIMLGVM